MVDKHGPPVWEKWARLRYGIIASLLSSPVEPGKLQEALKELACKQYRHPVKGDRLIAFGKSSIERWYYLARKSQDPIAALGRKVRSDAGSERVMSEKLLAELHAQYRQHRRWSYQLHWDNLVALVREKAELGPVPCYATVVRRMKGRGWIPQERVARHPTPGQEEAARRLETREVRGYEREHVHALWHSDGHQGSRKVSDSQGHYRRVVMIADLDDCSRLCVHGQWYLTEDAESFIHCFSQAAARRGLPRELMTDRGGAMLAQETQNGLARLGVVHSPTLPSSPYQNGKMEEFWAQVEGRLMPMLEDVEPLTLDFLNRATQAWLEMDYNSRRHDALGCSPMERLLEGHSVARTAPDAKTMRLGFCIQEQRTQRRSDGTITILGVRFELPSTFRYKPQVQVKYQSFDLSQAFLVDERTGQMLCRILPQDKEANSDGRRRYVGLPVTGSSDRPVPVQPVGNPLPPLMRQLLREYDATGMPPAYIPLTPHQNDQEEDHE